MSVKFMFVLNIQVSDELHQTFEFLIGASISEFERQLPLEIDVLKLYSHFGRNISENERIITIVRGIERCYEYAGIPTRHTESIRIKVKRLLTNYKGLLSKRKVPWISQRQKELDFANRIRSLFEVTANEALLSAVQARFLQDQRTIREEFFVIHPVNAANNNIQQNEDQENTFQQNDIDVVMSNDSDEIQQIIEHFDDPDYILSSDSEPEIAMIGVRKKHIPNELLKRISLTKASCRVNESLLGIGIELAGGLVDEYATSKSTIWRKISRMRSDFKENVLQEFKLSHSKIILQFDCKRFHKINKRHVGNDERIIILSHSENENVTLGLFAIPSHSGSDCTNKIVEMIEEYNLGERLVGFVCDTENVNSGRFNGVCNLVEIHLEKSLLHFMCRHHIHELVLKAVFREIFGTSTGPTSITIFKPLIEKWETIKQNGFKYEPVDNDLLNSSDELRQLVEESKQALLIHARNKNVRHDYAEITDLCLKFLGIQTQTSFKVVGAVDNARWMNKAIYPLKMFLFRYELDLDDETVKKLQRFCLFVAIIYTKFWNESSISIDAPINDLKFLKEMDNYKEFDREIALAGMIALKRHLWYLGDELVILSLFSKKLSNEEKDMFNLMLFPGAMSRRTCNSLRYQSTLNNIQDLKIHNFVSIRSTYLLERLEIDMSFLQECAEDWHTLETYHQAEKKIKDLVITVNDGSERLLREAELLINNQKVRSEIALQNTMVSIGSKSK